MKEILGSLSGGAPYCGVTGTAGALFGTNSSSSSDDTTLDISINAVGISLGKDDNNVLLATIISEYHEAMEYAYNVMKDDNIGVIHGVEIVPLADFLSFQTYVGYEK